MPNKHNTECRRHIAKMKFKVTNWAEFIHRFDSSLNEHVWDGCDAQVGEGSQIEPDWNLAAQPAPDFDVDQRVNW